MKGENKHPIQIRAKEISRRENSFASEEIYGSGGFSYRFLWDWAKLPPEIKGFEICGVCCDKDGYVYIATRVPGYPVTVFSPGGEWVRYIGQEVETGSSHGIYIGEEFHIWLTDRDRHVVHERDQNGRLLGMLDKYGCPSDTGVNDTVRDTRLIFYTEKRLGEPFNQPTRIVRALNGDLYASDGYANTAVHYFSQEGKLLNSWGGLGTEPEKFGIVHSVWADRLGRIWTVGRELDHVQVFDGEGHLIKVIDNLLYPTDVTADDHYIYVAERERRISVYNYDLQLTAQIGYWLSSIISHSMAVDHNGSLFLGQFWGNYNLAKLEGQQGTKRVVKHLRMFKDVRSKAERGNQINCGCVLQCGQFRYRYYWDWAKSPMELQGCTVAGVACDSHNNAYAAVRVPGCPGIAKFAPDGTFLGCYGKGIQKGRSYGIYIDKEDRIWPTDDTCHVVYKFDQKDQVMLTLGIWGLGSDTGIDTTIDSHLRYLMIRRMAGPFNMSTGITEGTRGDIYTSDGYGNAAVHRFDHQGELVSSWGGPGDGEGEFDIPHRVCADRTGRVQTADRDNDHVQIFDPKGELLHIIDDLPYPVGLWNDGICTYTTEMDSRISVYDMGVQLSAQLGYCASIFKAHSIDGDGDGNLYLDQFSSYRLPKLERIQ